jgi:hypothetical protein
MYPGRQTAPGIDQGTPFAEHQVVGLPGTAAAYSFPGGAAPTGTNPFTENDLRSEMGLPQRPSYRFPAGWNGGMGSPTAMAPTTSGGTQVAATGDPILDRMLAASQSGDTQGLKQATATLYERDGEQFKGQGAADLSRQQNNAAAPPAVNPPQIEPPELNAGNLRR